jgi:hypothetical protein
VTNEFRSEADLDILLCQRVEGDVGTFWQHAFPRTSDLVGPSRRAFPPSKDLPP